MDDCRETLIFIKGDRSRDCTWISLRMMYETFKGSTDRSVPGLATDDLAFYLMYDVYVYPVNVQLLRTISASPSFFIRIMRF